MLNSKKQDEKPQIKKSVKEGSLVKKGSLTINSKQLKMDSRTSLLSTKVNNTKQISIQLFSSKMKNSSKSTPIMTFKGFGMNQTSSKENEEMLFPEEKEIYLVNPSALTNKQTLTSATKKKPTKIEKIITAKSGTTSLKNVINVNKKTNFGHKSSTSKEDLNLYNKPTGTPDSKKGFISGFKKSVFDLKPKSSNFPLMNIRSEGLQLQHQFFHTPTNSAPGNLKNSTPTNQHNHNHYSNYILSTNYSENNHNKEIKDEEFELLTPETTPKNKQDPPPVESEIVTNIQSLGNILKSQTNNMEELFNNPFEMKKISNLNQMLDKFDNSNLIKDDLQPISLNHSHLKFHINDSRNLLMENNVIRRDTFIDNNFNKKALISEKNTVMGEIMNNSNNRMKKYGILFEFINTNIKEITEMVSQNNTTNKQEESVIFNKEIEKVLNEEKMLNPEISQSFINSSASDIDFYRHLIDQTFNQKVDNISNEMSTLHSKIDMSFINDKLDKTQQQYDDHKSKFPTPNNFDINETYHMNENQNERDTQSHNKINPRILLQHLREKQIEKKKNVNLDSKILEKVNETEDAKCIIF